MKLKQLLSNSWKQQEDAKNESQNLVLVAFLIF